MSVDMNLLKEQIETIPEIMEHIAGHAPSQLLEVLSGVENFLSYFHEINAGGALIEEYDPNDDSMQRDNQSTFFQQ